MEHNISTSPAVLAPPADLPQWAKQSVNLADPRIGASIHSCSDDFFAPAARMLQTTPAVFIPGKYDDNGKWMDGWESRRRRHGGYDWCIVKLGRPGTLSGVDLDTSFFTGNYPPAASIDGCVSGANPAEAASWQMLLDTTPLAGNQHHLLQLPLAKNTVFSHLRINIFPDGGLARLRVYGGVSPKALAPAEDGRIDLIALLNGGRPVAWNDAHFGSVSNLLLPGRGLDMGDGWETRRRREPGNDWCVIALALPGRIKQIEVDTAHFRGNYPDRVSLQAIFVAGELSETALNDSAKWPVLLSEQAMSAHTIHTFPASAEFGPVSHIRLNIFPDGGVSRVRLWGTPES